MRGKAQRLFGLVIAWLAVVFAGAAQAHELTMAELELRELARGEFAWAWTATERDVGNTLTLQWPAACAAEGQTVRCGEAGLRGTFAVDGVGRRYSAVIVRIHWLDGPTSVHTLTAAQPKVELLGAADDRRSLLEIASAYTALGVEHILSGVDHLLFVVGLLFLVGFERRLVLTITAFTAAHSVTLAISTLGWLSLRQPPVEALIALSILLVAGEALHARPTVARRWPALVAFVFGLVHGLGFAGALKEVGLPAEHVPAALLAFNVGVEVGQLLVVAVAWPLWRIVRARPVAAWLRRPALYAVGSVAAYWSIGRVAALLA